jgi:integrase
MPRPNFSLDSNRAFALSSPSSVASQGKKNGTAHNFRESSASSAPEKQADVHNLKTFPTRGTHTDSHPGRERRATSTVVTKERRQDGYFPESIDFAERVERARAATMRSPRDFALLSFDVAADIWLENHASNSSITDRTISDYRFYIRSLNKFFGPKEGQPGIKLSEIHIGHVIEYRRERQKTAGAECINHEITTLKQIMEMADLWDLIAKHYKRLKVKDAGPPRVLTADEEEKFFRVVAKAVWSGEKPEWEAAYLAVSLTSNTTAHGIELRRIQLKHLELDHNPPQILIVSDKTKFRPRYIPLNSIALKQTERLLERARRLGAYKPDHHLFPFCIKKGEYDPNRQASPFFIRSAFRSMRRVLGSEFEWLKPSSFRHLCFTKLFESGAADETIISIGGHGAIRMSRYYSRIRATAKLAALEKIAPKSESAPNRQKGARA